MAVDAEEDDIVNFMEDKLIQGWHDHGSYFHSVHQSIIIFPMLCSGDKLGVVRSVSYGSH